MWRPSALQYKVTRCRAAETSSWPELVKEIVERVHKFTLLGSVVSETGGTENIISRITKAQATFAQLICDLFGNHGNWPERINLKYIRAALRVAKRER